MWHKTLQFSSFFTFQASFSAGYDQHIGIQDRERNLHLDLLPDVPSGYHVGLSTPPRVLTVDDPKFPQVEEELDRSMDRTLNVSIMNGMVSMDDSKRR
jgi:hypothetical protein